MLQHVTTDAVIARVVHYCTLLMLLSSKYWLIHIICQCYLSILSTQRTLSNYTRQMLAASWGEPWAYCPTTAPVYLMYGMNCMFGVQ